MFGGVSSIFLLVVAVSTRGDDPPVLLQTTCAAAFRLTLKGWQRNERSVAEACASPRTNCVRPKGVWHLYFKMCAGLVVGRKLLNALFVAPNITWVESYSLASPKTSSQLSSARREGWTTVTVLRHPVDRLVAQFLATADDRDFPRWLRRHSLPPPRRGNDGRHRLWLELDNAYAKVLSGYSGGPPPGDTADAERALRSLDLVLVAEWLDTPLTLRLLADKFCFDLATVDLARYRRARQDRLEAHRRAVYGNASWWLDNRPLLADLAARNHLDLRLWKVAADLHRRAALANWRHPAPPSLPPLPCDAPPGDSVAVAHCWHLQFRAPPPADRAIPLR